MDYDKILEDVRMSLKGFLSPFLPPFEVHLLCKNYDENIDKKCFVFNCKRNDFPSILEILQHSFKKNGWITYNNAWDLKCRKFEPYITIKVFVSDDYPFDWFYSDYIIRRDNLMEYRYLLSENICFLKKISPDGKLNPCFRTKAEIKHFLEHNPQYICPEKDIKPFLDFEEYFEPFGLHLKDEELTPAQLRFRERERKEREILGKLMNNPYVIHPKDVEKHLKE